MNDYEIIERALHKLQASSPNEHARGLAALARLREASTPAAPYQVPETPAEPSISAREARARDAYASECAKVEIVPDWDSLPEETKEQWRVYMDEDDGA